RLTAQALAALPQLEISASREDTSIIGSWLADRGLARRIALRAPYLSAAAILARSDVVAPLSRRIAALGLRRPPHRPARRRTVMLWHRRLDRHPAHRWLRNVIALASKSL